MGDNLSVLTDGYLWNKDEDKIFYFVFLDLENFINSYSYLDSTKMLRKESVL